jgi:hypothetical protein
MRKDSDLSSQDFASLFDDHREIYTLKTINYKQDYVFLIFAIILFLSFNIVG